MRTSPLARYAQQAFPAAGLAANPPADPAPAAVELTERAATPSRPARSASPSAPRLSRPGNVNRNSATPAASVAVDIPSSIPSSIPPPIPGARLVSGRLIVPRASVNDQRETFNRGACEYGPSQSYWSSLRSAPRLYQWCTCVFITIFVLALAAMVAGIAVIAKKYGKSSIGRDTGGVALPAPAITPTGL